MIKTCGKLLTTNANGNIKDIFKESHLSLLSFFSFWFSYFVEGLEIAWKNEKIKRIACFQ